MEWIRHLGFHESFYKALNNREIICISFFIIQQIVTLSKYGHDALDICHP